MRWLLIGLLVSVGVLLYVAVAATRHVRRQRRSQGRPISAEAAEPGRSKRDDAGDFAEIKSEENKAGENRSEEDESEESKSEEDESGEIQDRDGHVDGGPDQG